jgi:hypothetical protein
LAPSMNSAILLEDDISILPFDQGNELDLCLG